MDSLLRDLKHGLRILVKEKGFTVTVLLTLALTIGANTAMWSVVRSVLFEPLAVSGAERLVRVFKGYPKAGVERTGASVPDFFERREHVDAFEEVALYTTRDRAVGEGGSVERLRSMEATPSLLALLRVEPQVGRIFSESEGQPGNDQRVILTHELWQSLFGGAGDVLGQDLRIDGVAHEVVGVLPSGFTFLDPEVRLWLPEAFSEEQQSASARHSHDHDMVARLADGASLQLARQQIDALDQRNLEASPEFRQILLDAGFHTEVVPLREDLVRDVRGTLFFLWGGVAFVLLIAVVNLTNLALVRSTVRLKELTTRFALGAGRGRVVAQLLAESLVLAVLGGLLGLAVGKGALVALGRLGMDQLPRGHEIALDGSGVLVTLALALLVGLVPAILPAVGVFRTDVAGVLRQDNRTSTGGRGMGLVRRGLVAVQVAFAFLLVAGAGLLLASFQAVLAIDPGFSARGVLTATVSLPASRYGEDADRRAFVDQALERLRALPGVRAAGATSTIPFGGDYSDSVILAEGRAQAPGESLISPSRLLVTPGYLEAMGIGLAAGRGFDGRDHAESLGVVLVDERLARRFWGDGDPLGRRLYYPSDTDLTRVGPDTEFFTVVGVVRDSALRDLESEEQRVGTYYFPMAQQTSRAVTFAVRSAADATAVAADLRRVVADLDPQLPVYSLQGMEQRISDSLQHRRSPMLLALGFAVLALVLASVGLYGVLAYLVSRRRRELGIRMALGSTGGRLFRLVLVDGLAIVAVGLAAGLAAALVLRRGLQGMLYGVGSFDPGVLTATVAVLAAAAVLACSVPGLRAARIDPARALGEE